MRTTIRSLRVLVIVALGAASLSCSDSGAGKGEDLTKHIPHEQLKEQLARYAEVKISYDESVLSQPERVALQRIVQAAAVMDEIFLRQVWEGNEDLRQQLVYAAGSDAENKELMADLYHFFRINFGPWNRLEHDAPFVGNVEKPSGAGYYPTDITKEEFEKFCEENPDQDEAMRGFFTRVVRDEDGKLQTEPYNKVYGEFLAEASQLLIEAAEILTTPSNRELITNGADYTTLATYLRSRAAAFSSNDYFQSDMDWMDVEDNIIDVTIGPYETYEDGLNGYKAAFEGFIGIRHPADSAVLADLKNFLPGMENNLPIPDEHKNMDRGTESPISVVDVVYVGGDSKAGVQTIAFNLPNDERVREAKGSKKVMLKNISLAKYDRILAPIAHEILDESQLPAINFDSYFTNVLMHELAHGLGPGKIVVDGRETTVSRELKTLYAPLEEAKADIMGLYNKAFLVDQGYITAEELEKSYVCLLPGFFRAIRFGTNEAHGRANLMEYNYLKEKGAISLNPETDRYTVHLDKMPEAIQAMTRDLCMIQALGNYENAEEFIAKYAVVPDELEGMLEKLSSIPTDIEPVYDAEDFLTGGTLSGS